MNFNYVYADLQVSLILKADEGSEFDKMTAGQIHELGQWLYLTLRCCSRARTLRMIDLIDKDKIRGQDAAIEAAEENGG